MARPTKLTTEKMILDLKEKEVPLALISVWEERGEAYLTQVWHSFNHSKLTELQSAGLKMIEEIASNTSINKKLFFSYTKEKDSKVYFQSMASYVEYLSKNPLCLEVEIDTIFYQQEQLKKFCELVPSELKNYALKAKNTYRGGIIYITQIDNYQLHKNSWYQKKPVKLELLEKEHTFVKGVYKELFEDNPIFQKLQNIYYGVEELVE